MRSGVYTPRDLRKKIPDLNSEPIIHDETVNICPKQHWGGPGGWSFED